MSQTPITVTYSLEEILSRIEGKIDKLDEKLTDKIDKLDEKFTNQINKLDEKIDKLTVEVATCTTNINNLDKRVEKLEGTQKNQIWTLITLLGGSLIAVGFRAFFMENNP
jgi:archaellum component FlaC